MVHRNKPSTPPSELSDPKWTDLKKRALIEKNNHDPKKECYRDATIGALQKIYKNKCAICERRRGEELEVDHYRPKKARNVNKDIHYNQPGYYWLCYEWTNLIPLCSKCNNNKLHKFPLTDWNETNRISDHLDVGLNVYDLSSLNSHELPLMINPELETQPEKHFKFTKDGFVHSRTDEGNETIVLCNLNRKDLRNKRLKYINKYRKRILSALADFNDHKQENILFGELISTFKELKGRCKKRAVFSLFHVYLYRYFDYFICSEFTGAAREKVNKYFNDFKKMNVN